MSQSILFITYSGCGGAERMTLLYAKILHQAGYKCQLLVLPAEDGKFKLMPFIPSNLPYDTIDGKRAVLPYKVLKYLRKLKPSCIFDSSFTVTMTVIRRWIKLMLPDVKVIFRESNMPSRHSRIQQRVAKKCLRYADILISQTEEMKHEMVKYYALPAERITVINNPIDIELIQEKVKDLHHFPFPDAIHYVAVGRVDPQKDYRTLLKAFSIVLKTFPASRLHIVGFYNQNSRYKKELDTIAMSLKIRDHVCFEGFQDNPYKYMKAANVFVLSSIYEGLPNVMQEAMYLGLPVVATRCIPYISQVIDEGKNGYTVAAGNPEEFAAAMIKGSSLSVSGYAFNDLNKKRIIIGLFDKLLVGK